MHLDLDVFIILVLNFQYRGLSYHACYFLNDDRRQSIIVGALKEMNCVKNLLFLPYVMNPQSTSVQDLLFKNIS